MQHDTWFGGEVSRAGLPAVGPSLGFLHIPDRGARGGVVICPPLGYEQVLGYRGVRLLSQELEAHGIASLRFDYVGEGDASGETAVPDAGERWLATIEQAVLTLRSAGIEHIVLAGLAAGALLASEAARRLRSSGVELDGLVLWDPALSGRRFVRRQKSLFDLTVGEPATDPERLTLLSLTLHPAAVAWLEPVELAPVAVDALALIRRAELGSPIADRFVSALPAGSSVVPVDGHAEWIEAPSALAVLPVESIRTIVDWVDARLPALAAPVSPRIRHEAQIATAPDGTPVLERLVRFGPENLFAIETVRELDTDGHGDAAAPGGVFVLQPGAAEHRVGPGRFQVISARELAARGTRVIRFDRRGTGDSTPVEVGEVNLIFADAWIDDAETLVEQLVGDEPVAHVGLCSGAWVAARIADLRPTRLAVLMSPTYFKLQGMPAGGYAEAARKNAEGGPRLGDLKGRIRGMMPGWAWRVAARLQLFHDPETLLGPATRRPGTTVALLFTPDDTANFAHHHGPGAVARLRHRGADLRTTEYPFGDHSMFGARVRGAMLRDVLDLAEQTFPVPRREDSRTAAGA
ncbi:MAG: alpha/beta hydrolase family protein [Pseudolysinimonas sp.]